MATHRLSTTMTTSAGSVITNGPTYTNDGHQSYTISIPDSTTDQQVVMTLDVSTLTSQVISCDQDITIETNNATTPVDTLAIKASEAYIWNTNSLDTNLLTTDVTAMYLTNSSGATANLEMRFLFDSTP